MLLGRYVGLSKDPQLPRVMSPLAPPALLLEAHHEGSLRLKHAKPKELAALVVPVVPLMKMSFLEHTQIFPMNIS